MYTPKFQPARTRIEAHTELWPVKQLHKRPAEPHKKIVVVHAGARDAYQLAMALSETDGLHTLVTDLFWPQERAWAQILSRVLPKVFVAMLRHRSASGVPAGSVTTCLGAGLKGLLLDRVRFLPFSMRGGLTRAADATLGRTAGTLAKRAGAALISYSYYAYDAFTIYGKGGVLFQMHPHPATMRRILQEELALHPDCAASLNKEWELALPEEDFRHLICETEMASHFLVASSFTRNSLIEHGAAAESIHVVPYGVDLDRFKPAPFRRRGRSSPLRLLFVGRINQRKGLKYLLEALKLLDSEQVTLTICGRVLDGLEMFEPFGTQVEIRPSVSATELVAAYQSADMFVLPSVGEGFGQVLLEALACGLPILSTTHTAAPDIIEDGVQGFVVEPRRPDLLAEHIAWALHHPDHLALMSRMARERAEHFTWQRFRSAIAASVATFLDSDQAPVEGRNC